MLPSVMRATYHIYLCNDCVRDARSLLVDVLHEFDANLFGVINVAQFFLLEECAVVANMQSRPLVR